MWLNSQFNYIKRGNYQRNFINIQLNFVRIKLFLVRDLANALIKKEFRELVIKKGASLTSTIN